MGTRHSLFKHPETGCFGNGDDGARSSRVVKTMPTKELFKVNNVRIAHVAEKNLEADNLIGLEKQILVAIMGDIELRYPHSRACCLRSSVSEHCCYLSDLPTNFGTRGQFLTRGRMRLCGVIAWVTQA